MTLRRPSIFLRAMVLGAQGVFYNLFCMFPCQTWLTLLTLFSPLLPCVSQNLS